MQQHRNPTCLITGAAGGLGMALAKIFTSKGYFVVATDCVDKPANLQCNEFLKIDLVRIVDDAEYSSHSMQEISSILRGRGLDVLVNNAAVQILKNSDSFTRSDWSSTLNVNLLAPYFFIQHLLSDLKASMGCVINISSVHARLTKREFVAYATSKAALSAMTRALAVDLGPHVRFLGVEPGALDTKMLREGFKDDVGAYDRLAKLHPVQSIGNLEALALFLLNLVELQDFFLSGSILSYDGGISNLLADPSLL